MEQRITPWKLTSAATFFCALIFFWHGVASADSTVEDRIPDAVLNQKERHYVTLTVENDLFGSGTDRNYTNGVRLSWFQFREKPPGFTRLIPFFDMNETTSTYYSVGHNLYTPDNISSRVQIPGERPWAAFLYGSMGMATLKDNHVDELELTLGVIGPLALGKPIQKNYHRLIGSPIPKGWDNQLENEPGIMASWQRRWLEPVSLPVDHMSLTLSPHVGGTIGNIYTYANAGATIKLASGHARWDDKPLQVKPSIPGTGFFVPSDGPDWEIFAGLEGRAIARNIFLDGNSFTDSYHVDKKPFVLDASVGTAFTWGHTRLSYTFVYRTKEFETQQDPSIFGGVSVGYNF